MPPGTEQDRGPPETPEKKELPCTKKTRRRKLRKKVTRDEDYW
jgi:hypothetical protein